jgi:hypothetical protein
MSLFGWFCTCVTSGTPIGERNLVASNSNFTGNWEYGGYALFSNNRFFVVPADIQTEGYVASMTRLPADNWTAQFQISFENNSQVHFTIWIASHFGPKQTLFGDLICFSGLAILFCSRSNTLEMEVRESNGSRTFRQADFFPTFDARIETPCLIVTIEYFQQNLTISVAHDGKSHFVSQGITERPLGRHWVTVTATNGNVGCPVYLDSVHISGWKFSEPVSGFHRPDSAVNGDLDDSALGVLERMDNLLGITESSGTIKDLHGSLREKLLPISQSWQRRAIWIRNSRQYLRQNVQDSLAQVEYLIGSFGKLLRKDMRKFYRSLDKIEHSMRTSLDGSLGDASVSSSWEVGQVLFAIAIVEALFAICVLPVLALRKEYGKESSSPAG